MNLIEVVEEKRIISFAWRWLGEKETHVLALPDFPGYKRDKKCNKALILKLHELMGQADIVVAHNAPFDDKLSNTDFITHGLAPVPPHKRIDTLQVARSIFKFSSNKLDHLGERLGLGRKKNTGGFALWKGCMEGDIKSFAKMKAYNRQDVILLHDIFLKLRPWMNSHPALKPRGDIACDVCHSANIHKKGEMLTRGGMVPRYQCQDCGKWSQGKLVGKKKERRWVIK